MEVMVCQSSSVSADAPSRTAFMTVGRRAVEFLEIDGGVANLLRGVTKSRNQPRAAGRGAHGACAWRAGAPLPTRRALRTRAPVCAEGDADEPAWFDDAGAEPAAAAPTAEARRRRRRRRRRRPRRRRR